MRDSILSIPHQLAQGITLGLAMRDLAKRDKIISCGMGGSAIAGEMLAMVRDDVIVHWDYDLPALSEVEGSTLVICTSWSGDTEETISSYEKARQLGMNTLVITTGGRLGQLATEHDSPLIILPHDAISPRTAIGYMAGALFGALGLADQLPASLDPAAWEQPGKDLAATLGSRTPVLYSSYPWRRITGFWKMAYSETAKRYVFVNWFPSGAHTEIVGWEGPYQDLMAPIIIRDAQESARYAKNFDALLALLSQKGYTVSTVTLSGNTSLEKVFNSYFLALWTSFSVAQSLNIDPNATLLLDEFKRLKAKK